MRVQVDPLRSASARDTGPVPRVALNGGYGEWTLPPGIGGLAIRFTPGVDGSEQFISLAPEDYEGESGGFTVYVPTERKLGPAAMAFTLRLDLDQYQADESVVFGPGADSRGVAHQVQNAPSGSTGLGIPGTVELNASVENDVQSWGVELGGVTIPAADNGISYGLGLNYRTTTQELTNTMSLPAFPGISARTDEEVEDQVLSIPLTVIKGWNAGGTARPNIFVRVAPGYYKSDLDGTYQFACNLCPPADQAFEQTIEDKDDGFTWSGEAGVGLNLHLGDRFVLGFYGRYSYLDRIGVANNRESPLDEPVHLDEDSADGWSAGINFGLEFRQ